MPDVPPIYLATAIEAVLRAGDIQMAAVGGELRIEKKSEIDLVTQIDLEVEREFRALVAERFPGHAVLGEEFEEAGQREQVPEFCWVFDPLDGTTNYAHGLPIFCASLALEIRGSPAVAAVYDPTRRELFTAVRDEGAWLNGRPLRVSPAEALVNSLLVTGFHYGVHRDPREVLALFEAFIRRARAVRRLGSAALDLCYTACGRFDGFWERKLQPWDISAGALIVQEAGGTVTTLDGLAFHSRAGSVLATNGRIHDQMLKVVLGTAGDVHETGRA